jgi:hypothetical protein
MEIVQPGGVNSGGSITLETNGVLNGDQTLLNLIAGTNITITDDGFGGITFDATGGGGTPAGSTNDIQYNDSGSFGADDKFAYISSEQTLYVDNVRANSSYGFRIMASDGTDLFDFGATTPNLTTSNQDFHVVGDLGLPSLTANLPLKLDNSNTTISGAIDLNSSEVTNTLPTGNGGTGLNTIGSALQYLRVNGAGTALEYATLASTGANTALSNLASVAINTTLVSDTNNTDDLGTTAIKWANLYVTNVGATGTRVTKGWYTDLESTNMPTVGGTAILSSLTAPSFTTVELGSGGATDTTLSRISAGVLGVEGKTVATLSTDQTWTGVQTFQQELYTINSITASGNAATIPITYRQHKVTNNSAATLTITLTTTSAVDGQMVLIRVFDFSAVAQTLTWVNTENSKISVPTLSNGSTTLPATVGFQFNGATSLWRCISSS